MALVSMATYCTPLNNRAELFKQTLDSLHETVNKEKHRIVIVDNSPADRAKDVFRRHPIRHFADFISNNGDNLGTAEAVNKGWALREAGQHCVKMDDDCVVHSKHWLDEMEEAIERDTSIGIIGLKRKDCAEKPEYLWKPGDRHYNDRNWFTSNLRMLPHEPGERWILVEEVNHVMGTCQMYNTRLLAKMGYLYQIRKYGFDDSLAAVRCVKAGFKNCFLPHIEIDHIDPGNTEYQTWKERSSGEDMSEYHRIREEYQNGTRDIYYNPFVEA